MAKHAKKKSHRGLRSIASGPNWRVTVNGADMAHVPNEQRAHDDLRFWMKAEPGAIVCIERRTAANKWRKVECSGRWRRRGLRKG